MSFIGIDLIGVVAVGLIIGALFEIAFVVFARRSIGASIPFTASFPVALCLLPWGGVAFGGVGATLLVAGVTALCVLISNMAGRLSARALLRLARYSYPEE